MDAAMAASWDGTLDGIIAGAARAGGPVVVASTLPELLDEPSAFRLAEAGIAPVAGLTSGLMCSAALGRQAGPVDRLRGIAGAAAARRSVGSVGAGWLAEHDAKRLLGEFGVAVPAGRLVSSAADAVDAAAELGYLVVLKLSAPDLLHKSDVGAVALDLADPDAVRTAYARLPGLCGPPRLGVGLGVGPGLGWRPCCASGWSRPGSSCSSPGAGTAWCRAWWSGWAGSGWSCSATLR
jgi:acyl-CoA synthetase (NDP forming)